MWDADCASGYWFAWLGCLIAFPFACLGFLLFVCCNGLVRFACVERCGGLDCAAVVSGGFVICLVLVYFVGAFVGCSSCLLFCL